MSTRAQTRAVSSRPSGPPPPKRRGGSAATSSTTAKASTANRAGPARPPHRLRRRRLGVVVVVLALVLTVAWAVSVSPLLDVEQVQVLGATRLAPGAIESAAGVHPGDAMLWIDGNAAVRGVEALPYVRAVTLERSWPSTVRITVRERTPAAWIDGTFTAVGKRAVIDGDGRVLQVADAPPPGLPQLLGAKLVPTPGGTIDATDAAHVAGVLATMDGAGVTSVERTDHGVVLHRAEGPEIRLGRPTQVAVKVRAALAVIDASRAEALTYVDVSVPTNPVAR